MNSNLRKELKKKLSIMKQRCYNDRHVSYVRYGGKGISICEEWLKDPELFCDWAVQNGFMSGLSIDRKNHKEGYSPDNCQFVTKEENRLEAVYRNLKEKTGAWSKEQLEETKKIIKSTQGHPLLMIKEEICFERKFQCLLDAAEYICNIKGLKTKPIQIKKNISACLRGHRKKCHGYTFKSLQPK